MKIIRWIIGIFFIFTGLIPIFDLISWKSQVENYNKEYVYNDNVGLYYTKNETKQYINKIFDKNGEIITLNVPNNKIIEIYCKKDNLNEGVYLNAYNSDRHVEQPVITVFSSAIFFILAFYAIPKKEKNDNYCKNNLILKFYIIYVYLFFFGIAFLGTQINNCIIYNNFKEENNVTTVYEDSEHILEEQEGSVYYYNINGEKYIFNNHLSAIGNKFNTNNEIYYSSKDPKIACSKGNPVSSLSIIIGISLIIINFPIVFFKNKMAMRY